MKKHKTILLTLLVMLLWGSLFPTVKLGYAAYDIRGLGDILLFAGLRFTVCGGVICLYALVRDRGSYGAVRASFLPVLLSGLFAIILHYSLTYSALNLTESSKTAIIKQLGALLYVCFSFLFFKDDKLSLKKLVGALLGFGGIVVINYKGGGIHLNVGDLLVIGASLCTVFSNVISKKALVKVKPVTMTGVSQLFGGLVLLAAGAALGGNVRLTADKWYIFAYICAASIISYCLWFGIVKQAELSRLFIVKFAEPVFACVFGALLLGENIFRWQYLAAFVLISAGICLAYLRERSRGEERP